MSEAESRALRRAVAALALVSVVRWAWEPNAPMGEALPDSTASVLADAARSALAEEERRARPPGPDETIDPNLAGEAELDRLPGVGPAKAGAIVRARDEGSVFRVAEDLLAVPGIGPALLERMRPHLALPGQSGAARGGQLPRGRTRPGAASRVAPVGDPAFPVDLNRAGPAELQRLPGVGPVTASRIVAARDERPFESLEDLQRVRGIGPATVERLTGLATAGPGKR